MTDRSILACLRALRLGAVGRQAVVVQAALTQAQQQLPFSFYLTVPSPAQLSFCPLLLLVPHDNHSNADSVKLPFPHLTLDVHRHEVTASLLLRKAQQSLQRRGESKLHLNAVVRR